MAAGDATRVWFPEMVDALVVAWTPAMTWEALGELCRLAGEQRRQIRASRGILAPLILCRGCGRLERMDIAGISIRSALFALKKRDVLAEAEFERLDLAWGRYRAAHGLDRYAMPRKDGVEHGHAAHEA